MFACARTWLLGSKIFGRRAIGKIMGNVQLKATNQKGTFFTQVGGERNVHSTSKQQTSLLDMNSARETKYSSMNCQGLKMELRRRGLKVSGRKLELIQRLCQSDETHITGSNSSRLFSTSKRSNTRHKRHRKSNKKPQTQKRQIGTIAKDKAKPKTKKTIKIVSNRKLSTTSSLKAKDDKSSIDYYKPEKPVKPEVEHISVPEVPEFDETTPNINQSKEKEVNESTKKTRLNHRKSKIAKSLDDSSYSGQHSDEHSDALFWGTTGVLSLLWWKHQQSDGRN